MVYEHTSLQTHIEAGHPVRSHLGSWGPGTMGSLQGSGHCKWEDRYVSTVASTLQCTVNLTLSSREVFRESIWICEALDFKH